MLELTPEFREKYIEVVEGRDFIRYDGLMELAHDQITSIDVELITFPTDVVENTAVVKATIIDTNGRKWSALGDASDKTCAPDLALHKIRIAETRAKGRALRDMLNIGMPMYEEIFPAPSQQTSIEEDAPITTDQIMRVRQYIDSGIITKDEARNITLKATGKDSMQFLTRAEADVVLQAIASYIQSRKVKAS